jgi:hypothetical protein
VCPLMKGTGDYHPEPDRAWSMPACDPTQTWDCAAAIFTDAGCDAPTGEVPFVVGLQNVYELSLNDVSRKHEYLTWDCDPELLGRFQIYRQVEPTRRPLNWELLKSRPREEAICIVCRIKPLL